MTKRGMLFVLSGPSGVGKGTVRKALFEQEDINFAYSISMTTRQPRDGEVDGKDYFFVTKDQFKKAIDQGQMLEYAQYVDNFYGTPLKYVNDTLDSGQDVFLEIDVNGATQVREKMPEGILIFLTPPDLLELKNRLINRGTESIEVIEKRIEQAKQEILMMKHYDYAVVNDKIENAVENIRQIINVEHLQVKQVYSDYEQMLTINEKGEAK